MLTQEVLHRIREGANVPVAPLARVIGCSPNHLWKLIRDREIEAVKVGATTALRQVSYPTLAEAETEAKEGAALCGWRYIGVVDEARLRRIADPFDREGSPAA